MRIQKHEWAPGLEKFITLDRGYGVRATQHVAAGKKTRLELLLSVCVALLWLHVLLLKTFHVQ